MVTQEDIAKKLKISRATVSKALSGKPVKEETKRAVLEEVERSGYKPNAVATILAQKHSRVIYAFIIATVDEGYGLQTYNGIRDAANVWAGYNIELKIVYTNLMDKGDQIQRQLQQFMAIFDHEQVDGIIFSALSRETLDVVSRKCKSKNIPLMTLDLIHANNTFCHVGPDYFKLGAYSAAMLGNLMKKKGKLLILDFDEGYGLSKERMRGFVNKLAEFPEIKRSTMCLESIGYSSYEKLLNSYFQNDTPDAIYSPYRVDHIGQYLETKGLAGEIIMISNGINDQIEEYLNNGIIRSIVSARPYFQGAVATNNFFKYFFRPNDFIRGNIDVPCGIYIKENFVRNEKIF